MSDEAPTSIPPNGRILLVVDDQESVRRSIAFYLEYCGYRVHRADSGKQALEIFRAEQIDGVLMDVQMPGMSGIEATAQLKALADQSGRPHKVWLMTGAHTRELEELAKQAGGIKLFRKPFDWEELLNDLRTALVPPSQPQPTP
jgi:CheY-like chemotaxis protein